MRLNTAIAARAGCCTPAPRPGVGIRILPECGLQVTTDRFRVPGIMIVPFSEELHRVVRNTALLCIEVLSPGDNVRRIVCRMDDYVHMGVTGVWVPDPIDGRVYTHSKGEPKWVDDRVLTVRGTPIRVDLDEIASDLAS